MCNKVKNNDNTYLLSIEQLEQPPFFCVCVFTESD